MACWYWCPRSMQRLYKGLINKTLSFSNWREHLPLNSIHQTIFFVGVNVLNIKSKVDFLLKRDSWSVKVCAVFSTIFLGRTRGPYPGLKFFRHIWPCCPGKKTFVSGGCNGVRQRGEFGQCFRGIFGCFRKQSRPASSKDAGTEDGSWGDQYCWWNKSCTSW